MSKPQPKGKTQGNLLAAAGELVRHGIQAYVSCLREEDNASPDLVLMSEREDGPRYFGLWVLSAEAHQGLQLTQAPQIDSTGFLLLHQRHLSEADEWLYLTYGQLSELRNAISAGIPGRFPLKRRAAYRKQSVSALARYLREGGPTEMVDVEADEITIPDGRAIQRLAIRHAIFYLGDAIIVGEPRRVARGWTVELISPGKESRLGELLFTVTGKLIEEGSATYDSVRARYYAETTSRTAA